MWIKTEIYETAFDQKPLKVIYADSVLEAEGKLKQTIEDMNTEETEEEKRGLEMLDDHMQENGSEPMN